MAQSCSCVMTTEYTCRQTNNTTYLSNTIITWVGSLVGYLHNSGLKPCPSLYVHANAISILFLKLRF